jgi:hypothetical protein
MLERMPWCGMRFRLNAYKLRSGQFVVLADALLESSLDGGGGADQATELGSGFDLQAGQSLL